MRAKNIITNILVGILAVGIAVTLIAFILYGFNLKRFSAEMKIDGKYNLQEIDINKTIDKVEMTMKDKNIKVIESKDEKYHLKYYVSEDDKVSYSINENVLKVENESKITVNTIGFNFKSKYINEVTLQVPKDKMIDYKLSSTNSVIDFNLKQAKSININTSNDDIYLNNLNNPNAEVNLGTSNDKIQVNNVVCKSLNSVTYNDEILFKDIVCKNLNAKTKNGDIKLNNIKSDVIKAETKNDNIEISINDNNTQYGYDLKGDEITYGNAKLKTSSCNMENEKKIIAKTKYGDVVIYFLKN